MALFGIDYAVGNPQPAKLKAADVRFVCRYVSTPGNPKNLTPAEAKKLQKAGIDVVVVFETTARRALAGEQAGAFDAKRALSQANACLSPAAGAIYFAVDFDAAPGDQVAINAYLRGAASVLGKKRVGIYGGYWPLKRALDAGVCAYGWQTYAWSGGNWDKRAQLRQVKNAQHLAGLSVDFDQARVTDFGQWRHAKKPNGKPALHPTDFIVANQVVASGAFQRSRKIRPEDVGKNILVPTPALSSWINAVHLNKGVGRVRPTP